jgi:hypothetical protein
VKVDGWLRDRIRYAPANLLRDDRAIDRMRELVTCYAKLARNPSPAVVLTSRVDFGLSAGRKFVMQAGMSLEVLPRDN